MARHRLLTLFGGSAYVDKVMGYADLTAYWPLAEQSGTVARCLVNPLQNGTYARDVSVMGTGVGIGDGNTAPVFDAANDYVNIYSAALNAALGGAEGTAIIWAKVSGAGVWTDGVSRRMSTWGLINNDITQARDAGNNDLWGRQVAGGTNKQVTHTTGAILTWMCCIVTYSAIADEVKVYFNGAKVGATLNGLGVWAGALSASRCCIGAATTVPASLWDGRLAHCAALNTVLTLPQVQDLSAI